MLQSSLDELIATFTELRGGLDELAEELVEKETLTGEQALEAIRRGASSEQAELLLGSAVPVTAAQSGNDDSPSDEDSASERAGMA